jgi:hypothetical protein
MTALSERVIIADGAMGTMIQDAAPTLEDFENLEDEAGDLPKGLQYGLLLLIKHYYDIREPVVMGTIVAKIPYTLEWLTTVYKNWTIK